MVSNYQTFPITDSTYKGTASGKAPFGERLIRANAAGDITFVRPSGSLTITVSEGFDCVMSSDIQSVSSTAEVLMS